MMKKALFLISIMFFTASAYAEVPFVDVKSTDYFYNDLDFLYGEGIIKDNSEHKFYPDSLIKRDEFLGIVVGVGCKECLKPSLEDFMKYKINPFADLGSDNPYFYCISIGKNDGLIQGYILDASGKYTCQNNITTSTSPFCPENNITRIEAITILLRSAKILGDNSNTSLVKTIKIEDVDDRWYPIARKGIEVGLLNIDNQNKVYPNEYINRKEFIRMAVKIFGVNSCELKNPKKNLLSSGIKIFDSNNVNSCIGEGKVSNLSSKTANKYDFYGFTETKGDFTYEWEFYNSSNGEKTTFNGKCIDDFDFKSKGNWIVKLIIKDKKTLEESQSYSQVNIGSVSASDGNISISSNKSKDDYKKYDFTPIVNNFNIASYKWDFGDSNTSTEKSPTHTYKKDGEYTVTLTTIDSEGKTKQTKETISVFGNGISESRNSSAISVNILANPISGEAPLKTDFQAITNKAGDFRYSWDFGNGTSSDLKNPSTVFKDPGFYTVVLKVTDNDGNSGVSQIVIEILKNSDKDSDGILDKVDLCPDVVGSSLNKGCPEIKEFKPDNIYPNTISSDINIYDMNNPSSCSGKGTEADFSDSSDTVYDFYGYSLDKGNFSYDWEFTNNTTLDKVFANGSCLNNFDLKKSGTWSLKLTILDKDTGKSSTSSSQVFIANKNLDTDKDGKTDEQEGMKDTDKDGILDKFESFIIDTDGDSIVDELDNDSKTDMIPSVSGISLTINADPILGPLPLKSNFTSIVNGGDSNYKYSWDFGDGSGSNEPNPSHTYTNPGVYNVTLKITDNSGNISMAQLKINAVGPDNTDSDKDGTPTPDDYCPSVPGDASNNGCPANNTNFGITNKCVLDKALKNGFINGLLQCVQCPCNQSIDFLSSVRSCDIIFPAIVSLDKKDIYSRGAIYQVK
ncbi:MAG: PKD domain-containing protein [Candidatus Gracilibacteria bacterium]|nr:PKD domain-containing protein [Candidatus Gracilibacteria bacterium]